MATQRRNRRDMTVAPRGRRHPTRGRRPLRRPRHRAALRPRLPAALEHHLARTIGSHRNPVVLRAAHPSDPRRGHQLSLPAAPDRGAARPELEHLLSDLAPPDMRMQPGVSRTTDAPFREAKTAIEAHYPQRRGRGRDGSRQPLRPRDPYRQPHRVLCPLHQPDGQHRARLREGRTQRCRRWCCRCPHRHRHHTHQARARRPADRGHGR
jgi:hypothetical protein